MSSARKLQWAIGAAVILLMASLLFLPIKGLVNPPKDKQEENSDKPTVSVATEVQKAKKQLAQVDLNRIDQLEEEKKENDPASIEALAVTWEKLGYLGIAGFYRMEKAALTQDTADWMQAAGGFKAALKNTADSTVAPVLVEQAISCYNKVLAVDSKNMEARTGLATCYVEGTPNPMQGIQMLLQIVKEDPNNYQANLNLGLFSMKSGQFDKAVKRFEKVIQIQPDAESYFYLAESYKNAGDKKKAIAAYETCAKLLPDASSRSSIEAYISELKSN